MIDKDPFKDVSRKGSVSFPATEFTEIITLLLFKAVIFVILIHDRA